MTHADAVMHADQLFNSDLNLRICLMCTRSAKRSLLCHLEQGNEEVTLLDVVEGACIPKSCHIKVVRLHVGIADNNLDGHAQCA